MSREHKDLRVFQQADRLVLAIYQVTQGLPIEERFGLQSQIRRAAVSAATNIVEGAARETRPELRRFLEIARGSSREVGYLLDLAIRLKFLSEDVAGVLVQDLEGLSTGLSSLMATLKHSDHPRSVRT